MVRPLTFAAALAATAALAGCAAAPAPGAAPAAIAAAAQAAPGAPADYFPLAVGNAWTFLDRSPQTADAARRIVRIVSRAPDGYFVDADGNALRADADCLHDRARRLLCAPLEAGRTWTSVVGPSVTEHYEIAGVAETVDVPAGSFKGCVRVRSRIRGGDVGQVAELTYAPGVGPVRLETFAVVGGVLRPQIRGELESYRLSGR